MQDGMVRLAQPTLLYAPTRRGIKRRMKEGEEKLSDRVREIRRVHDQPSFDYFLLDTKDASKYAVVECPYFADGPSDVHFLDRLKTGKTGVDKKAGLFLWSCGYFGAI